LTDQPINTTALRALATEAIKINEANRPGNPYAIPVKVATFTPECVLALLDRIEALEAGQLRVVNAAFDQQTDVEHRVYELNVKHANHMADIETHYQQKLQREKDENERLRAIIREALRQDKIEPWATEYPERFRESIIETLRDALGDEGEKRE
jgi:hypothetical protein